MTERLKLCKLECEECGSPLKIIPTMDNVIVCSKCGTVYIGVVKDGKLILTEEELRGKVEEKIKEVEKIIVKEKIIEVPARVPVTFPEPSPIKEWYPDWTYLKRRPYWLKYTPKTMCISPTRKQFKTSVTSGKPKQYRR